MGHNPDLQFAEPVLIYQTTTRYIDGENIFDIRISGPLELVNQYIETAPLILRMISSETAQEIISRLPTDVKYAESDDSFPPPPAYEIDNLDIEITITHHAEGLCVLYLEEDPPFKGSKCFYLTDGSYPQAFATCQTSFGNANLYLYEKDSLGNWKERDKSINSGTAEDSVLETSNFTGQWKLSVKASSKTVYNLTGIFPLTPERC